MLRHNINRYFSGKVSLSASPSLDNILHVMEPRRTQQAHCWRIVTYMGGHRRALSEKRSSIAKPQRAACIKSSAAHRKYLVGLGRPRRKRAPTSPCWTAGARCCAAPRLSSSTCATARERGLPVKTSRDNDKRVEILVRKIPKESMHCEAQRRAHTYNTAFRLYVPCMYTLTFMTILRVSIHLQYWALYSAG